MRSRMCRLGCPAILIMAPHSKASQRNWNLAQKNHRCIVTRCHDEEAAVEAEHAVAHVCLCHC